MSKSICHALIYSAKLWIFKKWYQSTGLWKHNDTLQWKWGDVNQYDHATKCFLFVQEAQGTFPSVVVFRSKPVYETQNKPDNRWLGWHSKFYNLVLSFESLATTSWDRINNLYSGFLLKVVEVSMEEISLKQIRATQSWWWTSSSTKLEMVTTAK